MVCPPQVYDTQIAGELIIEIIMILILWALAVMNTELLIRWNHFEQTPISSQSAWQFGQVSVVSIGEDFRTNKVVFLCVDCVPLTLTGSANVSGLASLRERHRRI
jgi:hypothetical protein